MTIKWFCIACLYAHIIGCCIVLFFALLANFLKENNHHAASIMRCNGSFGAFMVLVWVATVAGIWLLVGNVIRILCCGKVQ